MIDTTRTIKERSRGYRTSPRERYSPESGRARQVSVIQSALGGGERESVVATQERAVADRSHAHTSHSHGFADGIPPGREKLSARFSPIAARDPLAAYIGGRAD